jgi:hypothetical protein
VPAEAVTPPEQVFGHITMRKGSVGCIYNNMYLNFWGVFEMIGVAIKSDDTCKIGSQMAKALYNYRLTLRDVALK